jgi:GPH family glycoside/pentoside/hexuronide:cation symporter
MDASTDLERKQLDQTTTGQKALFGLSAIADQMTYQAFSLLVFVYYFAVVGLDMTQLWVGFTIWAIWNAFNDPLFGTLSDRTNFRFTQKFGKRKFYIVLAIIPMGLMMILLFTPPSLGQTTVNFIYFLVIIILFEAVYTIYSVNVNALFPEMFPTPRERDTTNMWIKGFTVLALMLGVVVPTLVLPAFTPSVEYTAQELASVYLIIGIIIGVVTILSALPFIFWGIREKPEYKHDYYDAPTFFSAAKTTLKNRTFLIFVLGNLLIWFVFGLLVTVVPLYAEHAIAIEGTIFIGLPLMIAFLLTVVCFPIHRRIARKFGFRKGMIITLGIWCLTLLPYLFLQEGMVAGMFIVTALQGFPLAGALYFVDLLISDVIDEDEVKTGVRREGSYYGMNAFIHRFSVILKISAIALVFTNVDWHTYVPTPGPYVALGLKALMVIFPVVALGIAMLIFKFFPLEGEKLAAMRKRLTELHELKKQKVTD